MISKNPMEVRGAVNQGFMQKEVKKNISATKNKTTCSPKGMEVRLLLRGMTSSVGLRTVNQERAGKSIKNSQFCNAERRSPGFTNVFIILGTTRKTIFIWRLNPPPYYKHQAGTHPISTFIVYL